MLTNKVSLKDLDRRRVLTRAVGSLFLLLFLTFMWIFFSGISLFSDEETGNPNANPLFINISEGQTILRRYKGQVVWVTHLSERQREQLKGLNVVLLDPTSGCSILGQYCVLSASTSRDAIYIQYSQPEPAQLLVGVLWFGGFVDPSSGELYDLLGRAYSTNKKTIPSLETVIVK